MRMSAVKLMAAAECDDCGHPATDDRILTSVFVSLIVSIKPPSRQTIHIPGESEAHYLLWLNSKRKWW